MAVQAQYPANLKLFNRGETETNNREMETDFPPPLRDQSSVFFSQNGGNVNPRKRGRDGVTSVMAVPSVKVSPQQQQLSVFSLQAPAGFLTPATLGLAQLQSPTPPLVSTGLRLTFNEQIQSQNQREQSDSILSSKELAAQINQQKHEIEQYLLTQGEQLRRAMVEKRQHHYRILLAAAENSLGWRLREKEAEVERAGRRTAELEDRLTRLCTEAMAWQAKAMEEQASAASLQAQLQQAAAAAEAAAPAGEECCDKTPAEDAASAYVDPERPDTKDQPCRVCRMRPASVVLLPCRHLCVCFVCESDGATDEGCPACGCFRTGSLQVTPLP